MSTPRPSIPALSFAGISTDSSADHPVYSNDMGLDSKVSADQIVEIAENRLMFMLLSNGMFSWLLPEEVLNAELKVQAERMNVLAKERFLPYLKERVEQYLQDPKNFKVSRGTIDEALLYAITELALEVPESVCIENADNSLAMAKMFVAQTVYLNESDVVKRIFAEALRRMDSRWGTIQTQSKETPHQVFERGKGIMMVRILAYRGNPKGFVASNDNGIDASVKEAILVLSAQLKLVIPDSFSAALTPITEEGSDRGNAAGGASRPRPC